MDIDIDNENDIDDDVDENDVNDDDVNDENDVDENDIDENDIDDGMELDIGDMCIDHKFKKYTVLKKHTIKNITDNNDSVIIDDDTNKIIFYFCDGNNNYRKIVIKFQYGVYDYPKIIKVKGINYPKCYINMANNLLRLFGIFGDDIQKITERYEYFVSHSFDNVKNGIMKYTGSGISNSLMDINININDNKMENITRIIESLSDVQDPNNDNVYRIYKILKYSIQNMNMHCVICLRYKNHPSERVLTCASNVCRNIILDYIDTNELGNDSFNEYLKIWSNDACIQKKDRVFSLLPIDYTLPDGKPNYKKLLNDIQTSGKYIWWLRQNLLSDIVFRSDSESKWGNFVKFTCEYHYSNPIFENNKKIYGIIKGYHGSPAHNWPSILLHGLANVSNTEFMANGAAFGKGVYLSGMFNVSYGYAYPCVNMIASSEEISDLVVERGYNKKVIINRGRCVAKCEIIKRPDIENLPAGAHYVIADPDDIKIISLYISRASYL